MERKGIYSIEEVRDILKDALFKFRKSESMVELDGDVIKGNSQRYQLFLTKGCDCVKCGIKGKYFAKERDDESNENYHLNLYAINEAGEEVLMTKDHTIPKAKGGKNHISNYQPMCIICNKAKGCTI